MAAKKNEEPTTARVELSQHWTDTAADPPQAYVPGEVVELPLDLARGLVQADHASYADATSEKAAEPAPAEA